MKYFFIKNLFLFLICLSVAKVGWAQSDESVKKNNEDCLKTIFTDNTTLVFELPLVLKLNEGTVFRSFGNKFVARFLDVSLEEFKEVVEWDAGHPTYFKNTKNNTTNLIFDLNSRARIKKEVLLEIKCRDSRKCNGTISLLFIKGSEVPEIMQCGKCPLKGELTKKDKKKISVDNNALIQSLTSSNSKTSKSFFAERTLLKFHSPLLILFKEGTVFRNLIPKVSAMPQSINFGDFKKVFSWESDTPSYFEKLEKNEATDFDFDLWDDWHKLKKDVVFKFEPIVYGNSDYDDIVLVFEKGSPVPDIMQSGKCLFGKEKKKDPNKQYDLTGSKLKSFLEKNIKTTFVDTKDGCFLSIQLLNSFTNMRLVFVDEFDQIRVFQWFGTILGTLLANKEIPSVYLHITDPVDDSTYSIKILDLIKGIQKNTTKSQLPRAFFSDDNTTRILTGSNLVNFIHDNMTNLVISDDVDAGYFISFDMANNTSSKNVFTSIIFKINIAAKDVSILQWTDDCQTSCNLGCIMNISKRDIETGCLDISDRENNHYIIRMSDFLKAYYTPQKYQENN